MLEMTYCCRKSFEFLDMRDFRVFCMESQENFWLGTWCGCHSIQHQKLYALVYSVLEIIGKAWHGGGPLLKISPGTLILESRTTPSKLFTQKVCMLRFYLFEWFQVWTALVVWISVYGWKGRNCSWRWSCQNCSWLSEILICPCSAEQGKTFELSSCSL